MYAGHGLGTLGSDGDPVSTPPFHPFPFTKHGVGT
jgi:hypothetical protein